VDDVVVYMAAIYYAKKAEELYEEFKIYASKENYSVLSAVNYVDKIQYYKSKTITAANRNQIDYKLFNAMDKASTALIKSINLRKRKSWS